MKIKYDSEKSEHLGWWQDIAESANWWMPYDAICFISERPIRCAIDSNRVLHHDSLAVMEFRDGWKIWALHGVTVPEWLVITPASDIDPKKIYEIDNAQVRAEFVRKIGADRIVSDLSDGPIDISSFSTADGRQHPYELHRLRMKDEEWTYLKMINPSVGLVHFEGVPNECQTVRDALMFRAGFQPGDIDEVNGAEWIQQGDVIMLPEGAKKFRLFPSQLS